jgi:hypothetical protein
MPFRNRLYAKRFLRPGSLEQVAVSRSQCQFPAGTLLLLANLLWVRGQGPAGSPPGKNGTASNGDSGSAAPDGAEIGPAPQPSRYFDRPLVVCTSSGKGAGVSCEGAPQGFEADGEHKDCTLDGVHKLQFCGYDVDLWRWVLKSSRPRKPRDFFDWDS